MAAHDEQEAEAKALRLGLASPVTVQQEDDVLDTWFSSSLFPFAVCGWPDDVRPAPSFRVLKNCEWHLKQ